MHLDEPPAAKAGMLIRRPAADVFNAIVDPAVTTRFWFTHSSGRLDGGKPVRWEWRMYSVSTTVTVSEMVPNERIVMQWSDPPTTVFWTFAEMPDETTFLDVRNFGFSGTGGLEWRGAAGLFSQSSFNQPSKAPCRGGF